MEPQDVYQRWVDDMWSLISDAEEVIGNAAILAGLATYTGALFEICVQDSDNDPDAEVQLLVYMMQHLDKGRRIQRDSINDDTAELAVKAAEEILKEEQE